MAGGTAPAATPTAGWAARTGAAVATSGAAWQIAAAATVAAAAVAVEHEAAKTESSEADASFDSIKLSKTAQKALEKAGYTTLADVQKLSEEELKNISGLTDASIKKIKA